MANNNLAQNLNQMFSKYEFFFGMMLGVYTVIFIAMIMISVFVESMAVMILSAVGIYLCVLSGLALGRHSN